jgi:hypothetical protein
MNFIIEQQAQFAVDIQLLKERQAETGGMTRNLVDVTRSLARHAEETDLRLRELGEETDRQFRETDLRLRELREESERQFLETDLRLRELREGTDRQFRETDLRLRELGEETNRQLRQLGDTVDKLLRRNSS